MAIKFRCKNCGQKYELDNNWCEKVTSCIKCGFAMHIPALSADDCLKLENAPAAISRATAEKSIFQTGKYIIKNVNTSRIELPDDILFRCKICGQKYRLEKKMSGQLAECGRCKRNMVVPSRSETFSSYASNSHTLDDNLVCWCKTCGQKYRLNKNKSGNNVRCSLCREHFTIPYESEKIPPPGLAQAEESDILKMDVLQHDTLSSVAERTNTTMDATKTVTDLVKYVITLPRHRLMFWEVSKLTDKFNQLLIFSTIYGKCFVLFILIVILLVLYFVFRTFI